MPQSLLVFKVPFTLEKPNFGTFGVVAAHTLTNFKLKKNLLFNCVYAHI